MHGTPEFPFSTLVADTIREHGLRWAVRYYAKRLPAWERRFFLNLAYCGA